MKYIIWLKMSLLIILVGCAPRSQPETPIQEARPAENVDSKPQPETPPEGIRPKTELDTEMLNSAFSGMPLIDKEAGNCPTDEIEIPGEGGHARGFINGLGISPNPVDSSGASIPTFDPLKVGQQMFATAAPSRNEPTAIIIVDDFNGDLKLEQRDSIRAELGLPGVYFLDQQRDQPTLADLTSGATEAEVKNLEAIGQYSHGALVFNHTLALLSAEDPNPEFSFTDVTVPKETREVRVLVADFTQPNVVVAALDTQDFNTEIIGGRLQATIRTLALERQIQRFAVNLSFGLVPCSVLADIQAAEKPNLTFEDYRDEVLDANGLDANQFRDDLVNVLTTPVNVDSDPLLTGAEADPERFAQAAVTDITYLAAAGNYALPYSLYPGYWSEFVSTSAQNLADTSTPPVRDPDYSNTGEVLAPGGYYTLTAYDPNTSNWNTYPNISIAGTSFAAPVMSVFTALDFTLPAPRCARISPSVTSPLAFFKTDPTPTSPPASGLNITLERALDPAGTPRICGTP